MSEETNINHEEEAEEIIEQPDLSELQKFHEANSNEVRMNFLYRFFCWCSGARIYILKKCPSDYNTFFGIGIIIFLTGIMATISGSYAFYTVFESRYLSACFGLFWGTLIFFLDWYLVSSLKKQNKKKNELLMSIPRFILAFFLAVVISKPIELKLFEKEINNKIASNQLNGSLRNQSLIDKEFKEIDELKFANENMALQIKYKETERNKLFEMVIKEAEGQSSTGIVGKGPVYREKKQAYDKAEVELTQLKENFLPLISENTKRMKMLTDKRDKKLQENNVVVQNTNGFLARLEAMTNLNNSNPNIALVSTFILLLFICIESAPLFVKLISSRGAYDEFLDVEQFYKKIDARRQIAELRVVETKQFKIQDEKTSVEFETAVSSNADFASKISEAQSEINSAIVDKWKKEELNKIEHNFKEYIPRIEHLFGVSKLKPSVETVHKDKDGSVEEKMVD